jgi:hypothetical protein
MLPLSIVRTTALSDEEQRQETYWKPPRLYTSTKQFRDESCMGMGRRNSRRNPSVSRMVLNTSSLNMKTHLRAYDHQLSARPKIKRETRMVGIQIVQIDRRVLVITHQNGYLTTGFDVDMASR